MDFDPIVKIKFDSDSYNNPVQTVWDWCESMQIEFDFMGFDTIPSENPDMLHAVTVWLIPDEHDHLTFRLRWGSV